MKEYKALKPYLLKHSWTYDEATKIIAGFIDAHDEIEKELEIKKRYEDCLDKAQNSNDLLECTRVN